MRDVIGHAMANHSPYFKDLEGWRNDHTDWLRRDVLNSGGGCSGCAAAGPPALTGDRASHDCRRRVEG